MKTEKKKWFRSPVEAWNISESEKWLGEMAAQGWMPLNFAGEYGRFRQAEPTQARFRLEPGRGESLRGRQEREAFYEEMGWQYVEFWGDYQVYCATDPAAPELYTDAESRGYVWKRELKKLRRGVVTNVFGWLLWGAYQTWFFFRPGVLRYALELNAYAILFLVVLMLLGWHLAMLIRNGRMLRRVQRQIEAGVEPTWEPAGANRRRRRWERIVIAVALVLLVVGVVTAEGSVVKGNTLAPKHSLPYVPLEELVAETEELSLNTHRYHAGKSLWMPEYYEILEQDYDDAAERIRPATDVYAARLRLAALAAPLYQELLQEEEQMYLEGYTRETLNDARFDEAVLLAETYEDGAYTQALVVRRGRCVLRQSIYAGPEDAVNLYDHLDAFAAILAAWQ